MTLRTAWPWQINYDVLPRDGGFLLRVREEGEEPPATRSGLFLIVNLPQALERALQVGDGP